MKEQLSQENREALAAYRYRRAQETLKEIPFLKQQGYYNTAINRLYYACYYAAVALLIKDGINPGTHAGVKQMLGMHFVATGRLSREMGRNFSLLFERRHSSDYDDFAYSDAEEIDDLLPKAEAFIHEIGQLLQTKE
ncbi:MAG TPA: HEPN domain-containing protein [Candidatus Bacteroides merdigallinarum]|uniref:HEPN domain-containing protein n=1 Tax=Candidatus Bacteroides merdigallinarum TaxID=2838473 RepID=A0A9D2E7U0_9BACE|nr:HEPN domain-containing protein [Candidatus Bacteroides merdigallinarum]